MSTAPITKTFRHRGRIYRAVQDGERVMIYRGSTLIMEIPQFHGVYPA